LDEITERTHRNMTVTVVKWSTSNAPLYKCTIQDLNQIPKN